MPYFFIFSFEGIFKVPLVISPNKYEYLPEGEGRGKVVDQFSNWHDPVLCRQIGSQIKTIYI